MKAFSPTDAGLEGFRIARENPKAFLRWAFFSFVVSFIGAIVTVNMPPNVRRAVDTLGADETPDPSDLMTALLAVSPLIVFGLAVQCMMAAAIYRIIFRHDEGRFGYLRLGLDEFRLMALTVIYALLLIVMLVLVTLGTAVVMSLASVAGSAGGVIIAGAVELFAFGLLIFVFVRLSLAPVVTFAERRLALFESWNLTRGSFWRLFGAYVLALACIVVISLLALVLFTTIGGAIVLMGGGQFSDLGMIFSPDETSLRTYLHPGMIAYMVMGSIIGALYYAVIAAPGAVAYQHLHGEAVADR